jgi:hypothetical protein
VTVFCLVAAFVFGSGVALEFESAAREPPFDSRFFNDSFFDLAARSRAWGASSLENLATSGLRGDETAGWWSSSTARFCGIDGVSSRVSSRAGEFCFDILTVCTPYASKTASIGTQQT